MFAWNYGLFENAQRLLDMLSMVTLFQNDQAQYRTSKFFEVIFQVCCQKFHSNSFAERHFVVSTMTPQGFLNVWHSK